MEDHTLYQLALARINGIGPVYTKKLIEHFGDAAAVFHAGRNALERTGLPSNLIDAILGFSDYPGLQSELRRLKSLGARTLFYTDPGYPRRLLPIPTAPALLFYQGTADLNAGKIIAIAGTRQPTEYGKQMTAQLIGELATPGLLILSGLAFGVDAIAHRTAIRHQLPTIGVLGHGLDHLYPAEHRGLACEMRRHHGGLITSFLPETGPESYTFPLRNQLIAGLCDALVVIESSMTGGSLSAADAALQLGKKVFVLPGRITDEKSQGCLNLIYERQALPLLSAGQLKATMAWGWPAGHKSHQPAFPFSPGQQPDRQKPKPQRSKPYRPSAEQATSQRLDLQQSTSRHANSPLAASGLAASGQPNLAPFDQDDSNLALEAKLISLLTERSSLTFENFITLTHEPVPAVSVALINLEIKGIIRSLPGRRYHLAS
ncbi:MAG TPA: DNA-processing protein DprA [Puia sp.]|jgi:DNA processing protein|nr:DNA-processing protein DprA [Puia sp.]